MTRLIHAEVRKLTSVTWFKVTVLVAVALAPISVISAVLGAGKKGNAPLGTVENIHHVLSSSALTSMVMLAVGVAMAATEYRHGTSIPTFLVTPRRADVVVAKLITAGALGAAFGAVEFGISVGVAVPTFAAKGVHHLAGDTGLMLLGAVVASALYGALGVAIGTISRSVVGAMIAALIFVQLVEQAFLDSVFPTFGRWLPTGANLAITRTGSSLHELLAPPAAVVVLIVWTALFAGTATRVVARRDV